MREVALSASFSRRVWAVFISLAGLALVIRLALLVGYQPVAYSDTASYRRLAEQLSRGWVEYDASRTPGYPIFLALTGTNERAWLAQMSLGILLTLLFFYLGWELAVGFSAEKRLTFAALASLAHTLNLGQLFFESALLTETLATFWLVLALAGFAWGITHADRRSVWLCLGIGLASSLAAIVRPLFVFLPFGLAALTVLFWRTPDEAGSQSAGGKNRLLCAILARLKTAARWWTAICLPAVVILGGWVGFLRHQYGVWGLSVMTGYHLIQNTGTFFEYLPDEYAPLRDTYLKYRDAQVAEHGTPTNAIWDAIPEMQEVSGQSFIGLSQLLTKLSLQLMWEHPDLYLQNIVKGWWLFWRAPVYWSPEAFRWQQGVFLVKGLILGQRAALFACNLFFLAATALFAFWKPFRRWLQPPMTFGFLASVIWFTSLIQTFLDHGDNARFLAPLQSVVVLCVLWIVLKLVARRGQSPIRAESELSGGLAD